MRRLCADAGFLIAVYDERDDFHLTARQCFAELLDGTQNRLIVPWPALYETLSTRMARSAVRIERMYAQWKSLSVRRRLDLLDDASFRERALDGCFLETVRSAGGYRPLSLVDRVMREMLSDVGTRIDAFLTFNARDFVDVCNRSRCELLPAATDS